MSIEAARKISHNTKGKCDHCDRTMLTSGLPQHMLHCYLNPVNIKLCPVCNTPIKNWRTSKTCGYSCSNTLFRSGPNNGAWKDSAYITTCFHHHEKKCVVCDEFRIVEVHHLDENHNNNDPSNLIPLCPTHHKYWHSRYKHLIEKRVLEYIQKWSLSVRQDLNLYPSGPKPDAPPN